MRRLLAATMLMVSVTGISTAHAYDGKTPIWFFNVVSCGEYAQDRKLPTGIGQHGVDRAYVAGWLSAANTFVRGVNLSGDTQVDNTMLWLDGYCMKNPFNTMQLGLMEFDTELAKAAVSKHR